MSRAAALQHESSSESRDAGRVSAEPAVAAELGNQAVQSLVAGGLRAKLEVGGADDPEEREADRLADQVISGPTSAPCACGGAGCSSCGGGKIRRKAEGGGAPPAPAAAAGFGNRSGRPLDLGTRRHFEPRFGADFGAVRIHDDPAAHRVARGIGARAFAIGNDIGFARGRHSPDTTAGRALLAHELAHVALGHGGTRRREDSDLWEKEVYDEEQARKREAAAKHHQAGVGAVDKKFSGDLAGQSKTVGEEKDKVGLAVLGQRAAAFDAAASGEGWLNGALAEQGYTGPDLAAVRLAWGDAVLVAEDLAAAKDGPDGTAKLAALTSVPAFYEGLATFSAAVELAHKTRYDKAVEAARVEHQRKLAEYERAQRIDRDFGPRGEPGAGAARGAMAIMRGPPPQMPVIPAPPAAISGGVAAALERVYAAATAAQWLAVTGDVRSLGAGLSKLVVSTLPETSAARIGVEYVEKLEEDLTNFEKDHPLNWRVPATFYPLDQLGTKHGADGTEVATPKSIPWQFYLTNTGVTSYDKPATSGGQWVLTDLTSGRGFKNTASTSDLELARLQQGEAIDPPLDLFSELNSSIRFPEGRLYFTLPSGTSYVLTTTEPISLSDFLAGLGLALAAVALVAGAVVTGGAAVALYAGVGAAVLGVGSTLADLHEKDVHGILKDEDVDKAMVAVALDLVSVASMGLGKIVGATGAAARFGNRFVLLSRITKIAQGTNLLGDLYQAMTVTEGFIKALSAIDRLPEDQRDKARAQLIRRGLLAGAMMTIAIRGDIGDLQAGGGLRVSHMDAEGALVPHGRADAPDGDVHPRGDMSAPLPHSASHADVSPATHATSEAAGNGLLIGAERHAVGVAGTGKMRDIYFCSDRCTALTARIAPVLDALPRNHPMRPAFEEMLLKARQAREALASGKMSQAEAEAFADATTRRIRSLTADDTDGGDLVRLLEMDPTALDAVSAIERARIARDRGIRMTKGELDAESRALAQQPARGTSEDPAGSPEAADLIEAGRLGIEGPQPKNPKTELYSPWPADKPRYPAGGIPPKEGSDITASIRKLLNIPPYTGVKGDPNVAVAEAFIDGQTQLLTTVSSGVVRPGMVELPDKTQFKLAGSGFQTRAEDTERKLLEHLADRLSPNAKGVINLFTERPACPWCKSAITEFEERFPGIKVKVTHN